MFGSRVRKKEIKGKEVQIYLLRAGDGIAIAQKLSSIVASFLGSAGMDGSSDGVTIDFSKIAEALSKYLSEKELIEIITKLLKEMTINGSQVNFDEYFSGNYGELLAIMSFALQENFGSFFDGMATLGE